MLERPAKAGERALLVHMTIMTEGDREQLAEFEELARSAGAIPVTVVEGSRDTPDPRFFVGKGKAEEIATRVRRDDIDIVLFNHALTPTQERNLERECQCRVLDRTGLILDIFAQRARSSEGKLQVELAQLKHLSTRLVRGWTHLERQKGGIGLRGPGETQLETDRRLIVTRIKQLKKKLEKVRSHHDLGQRARQRAELPMVSLVGYTNAGKSTLFNSLTGSEVYAANQLFATLDPTLRKMTADGDIDPDIVLSDTVGFIRHLPHDLVEAFRSTLDQTREAGLLLHVIDASDADRDSYIEQVNLVLEEIGANEVPQIKVFNKIDLTDIEPHVDYDTDGKPVAVWVSAISGAGLEELRRVVREYFAGQYLHVFVRVPVNAGKTYAKFRSLQVIHEESVTSYGDWVLRIEINRKVLETLKASPEYEFEVMGDAPVAGEARAS